MTVLLIRFGVRGVWVGLILISRLSYTKPFLRSVMGASNCSAYGRPLRENSNKSGNGKCEASGRETSCPSSPSPNSIHLSAACPSAQVLSCELSFGRAEMVSTAARLWRGNSRSLLTVVWQSERVAQSCAFFVDSVFCWLQNRGVSICAIAMPTVWFKKRLSEGFGKPFLFFHDFRRVERPFCSYLQMHLYRKMPLIDAKCNRACASNIAWLYPDHFNAVTARSGRYDGRSNTAVCDGISTYVHWVLATVRSSRVLTPKIYGPAATTPSPIFELPACGRVLEAESAS